MKVKDLRLELNKLHDDSKVEVWFHGFNDTMPLCISSVKSKSNSISPPYIGVLDITVAPISLTPNTPTNE